MTCPLLHFANVSLHKAICDSLSLWQNDVFTSQFLAFDLCVALLFWQGFLFVLLLLCSIHVSAGMMTTFFDLIVDAIVNAVQLHCPKSHMPFELLAN